MLRFIKINIIEICLAVSFVISAIIMFDICLYEPLQYKLDRDKFCEVELVTTTLNNVISKYSKGDNDKIEEHKKYYMNCYYKYGDAKYNQVVVYDELPKINSKSYATMNKETKQIVCITWYDNIMWVCIMLVVLASLIWFVLIF